MSYKNLIVGLMLSISVFSIAYVSGAVTEKQNPGPAKKESHSSSGKETAMAEKKTCNEAVRSAKNGTYELKNQSTSNEFNVQELSGNRLKIEFLGTYIYEVNGEETANTGDAKGLASLKNDRAEFTPEYMDECTMTLIFSEKTLKVTDNGKCVFGLNVSAVGTYKKTSDVPTFMDDEEVSENKDPTADSEQSKIRVKFAKGRTSATVTGRIRGYDYVDYIVGARKGQTLTAKLSSASRWPQFVVFDSNKENLEGSIGETDFKARLPQTGDYIIRVLMPRAEARRKGSMADYSLWIEIR